MKPLVYYCRWQGASLRLRGRDETAVWGQLVFNRDGNETTQRFRFNLHTYDLTLTTDSGEETVTLDEMGVVSSSAPGTLP
ncbi:MAG: hypothetical protein KC413_02455 [Anaerolineales bacterium]|nr:hypothetical protein [Anaerolineales bacterium]MCA9974575.1 hypothetical protein [Anaerolineales bacterium]MCB8966168.1 hypothetical protein [Ardenticatenaceae bacterium]